MTSRPTTSQARLRLLAGAVAIVGLALSIWIYLTAAAAPENPLGYAPEDSKRYLRDMQRYGGKANLIGSEIAEWLNGLWHGRRLAFTVACITLLVAGALVLAALPLPPDVDGGAPDRDERGRG
ncbi:MAG TPA: hypothetical protein VJ829_14170 [Candidatus Binatia bacterium]|jgi:hypothetical protein|nr:hypothetical protein [Candidatus Binatia bacterium]